MADRFPLILNTSANQIQEIASGDILDLTGVGINNVGVITSGNVSIGAATTDLVVTGDARITGILTVGTSSLKLDGPNNLVNVGTALTLGHTQGLQFHTQNLHSAGFEVNQINASGIITATEADINGDLDVDGHTNLDNVSVAGVSTFAGNINGKDITLTDVTPSITFYDSNANSDFRIIADNGVLSFADITNNANRINLQSNGNVNIQKDLDVDGHTNLDNVSIAGVATITGNLNVGGVLTYEDVTNVDSIGIITARNGITVSSGTATFQGAIDANGDLDVDGHTNLDNVSIAGVTTMTGAVTTGDHITLSGQNPHITFTDSNHNPDFEIYGSAGNFKIWDSTSNVGRLIVNSDGHVDIPGNLDCGAGLDVTGNVIASGNVTAVDATFSGNVSVGGTLTYEDVTNIDSVGLITARTGIRVSANGDLRFANGTWSGEVAGKIQQNSNKLYIQSGTSGTQIRRSDGQASWEWNNNGHFIPGLDSNVNIGENAKRVANIYADTLYGDGSNLTGISVGISTNAQTVTNGNTLLLDLTKDDHKVTATGTVTISCTGGTEGDSHTVRIVNSGITTVGFSTYFLFPSGGAPNIPITSGTISLISFTVHRAGAVGVSTQLLSGASVSFAWG